MPLLFVQQDITQMAVDAIVNAANPQLQMGSGVCGAIFRAAGPQKLQAACDQKAPIRTGEAALTPGFALPARYVIHAAGPVYKPPGIRKKVSGCFGRRIPARCGWRRKTTVPAWPFP